MRMIRTHGLLLSLALVGRAGPVGRPLITAYGSRDYGADAQNWALVQDHRGLVYAANNRGVLEFDGARWRLLPLPGGRFPRTLARDAQGRIWVGGEDTLGCLEPDGQGSLRVVSLTDRLAAEDREFGQVWSVHATPLGVCFVTASRLFQWDGRNLRVHRASGAFFLGYTVGDRCLVIDSGRGLLELTEAGLQPVPGGAPLAQHRPRFIVPWRDRGRPTLLVGIRKLPLQILDSEGLHPWHSEADAYLDKHVLSSGIRLADGSLALSTLQGGLLILDPRTGHSRPIAQAEGLANETAYCLLEDPRGALWVGGSRGIERVGWPPTLSRFGPSEGLPGVVLSLARLQGDLYASTQRGLYRLPAGAHRFEPVPGIQGQCWELLPQGPTLLVANYEGLFEVRGGRARRLPVPTGHTTCLVAPRGDQNRLWVGTVNGLFDLRREGPGTPWHGTRVEGIRESLMTLVEDLEGHLWAGCDAPVVLQVTPSPTGPATVARFGPAQGLPSDPWFFTTRLGSDLRAFGPSGVFRFEGAAGRFEPDARLSGLDLAPLHRVAQGSKGSLWVAQGSRGTELRQAVPSPSGSFRWQPAPGLPRAEAPVYVIQAEADGSVWFGGEEGLLHREPSSAPPPAPAALVRSLASRDGHTFFGGFGSPAPLTLPHAQRSVRVEFSQPPEGPGGGSLFQVRLEGLDEAWSPWGTEAFRDYTNLRPGRYRLQIRARSSPGAEVCETALPFRVLPPWWMTWWAFGAYGLTALLATGTLHRLRVRLLLRRNRALEARVAEATRELLAQAVELETMNAELLHLDAQKDHFLSIVSHDLKAPLAGIVMAAESLKADPPPDLVRRTAEGIEREGQAMGALLQRFLSRAALESGQVQALPEALPVADLLAATRGRYAAQAEAKGIPLEVVPIAEGLRVEADPLLLQEVLDNLVSNALKFSPPGHPVHLFAEASERRVLLGVRDHGPGLRPEDLPKLFTRFGRLSARPTAGEGSVGLGLAISRHLVTLQGGFLDAADTPGGGATFRIDLPRPQASR